MKQKKNRTEQSRAVFNEIINVLCRKDLSLHLRIKMLRLYVFSVLIYKMDALTLKKNIWKRLRCGQSF